MIFPIGKYWGIKPRVYQHLQTKRTITNAQAHNLYGIRHLPAVIRDIKKNLVSVFMTGQSTAKTDSVRNVGGRFTACMKKKNQKQLKDMAKELEKYKNSVFFLNKLGGLVKVRINSLDDYNHGLNGCELHHYIPYSSFPIVQLRFEQDTKRMYDGSHAVGNLLYLFS